MVIAEAVLGLGFKVGPAVGRFLHSTVTNGQLTIADRISVLTESFVQGICQSANKTKSQSCVGFAELVRQPFCVCLVASKCLSEGQVQSENCLRCITPPGLTVKERRPMAFTISIAGVQGVCECLYLLVQGVLQL